jgi:hypothetical protein
MAKPVIKPNHKVRQIFEDLEEYLDFCRSYGYKFNEGDLYNWKSYAYQQFNKFLQKKNVKDMWLQDLPRRF